MSVRIIRRPVPLNLWNRNTPNTGDRFCGTSLYMPLNAEPGHLDQPAERTRGRVVIVGGGGLLYPPFRRCFDRIIASKPAKLILWGVGTNTHGQATAPDPEWFGRCDLIGLRDWGTPHYWAPCASCLSPLFDDPPRPVRRAVVYCHYEQGSLRCDDAPVMLNRVESMEEAVRFLASGEIVVTNSYHGAYWATLLRRRVVVKPFSSRFHGFRHSPAMLADGERWQDAAERARVYPDALDECRSATRRFADLVNAIVC